MTVKWLLWWQAYSPQKKQSRFCIGGHQWSFAVLNVEREYKLIKKRNTTRLDVNRNEKKDDLLLCRLVRCLTSHCSVQCSHILRIPPPPPTPPESLNYKTKWLKILKTKRLTWIINEPINMFYLYCKPEKMAIRSDWWIHFRRLKIVLSDLYNNIYEYVLTFMSEVYVLWDVIVSTM